MNNYQIYFNGRFYHGKGKTAQAVIRRIKQFERRGWNATHPRKGAICQVTPLKSYEYGKGIEI